MRLCGLLVRLFSGVDPVDSLLKQRLSSYFRFPPQADLPDSSASVESAGALVTLPAEDTATLVEVLRRQRPVDHVLKTANVSPIYAALRGAATIPHTREANLIIQNPKNGEDDWTVNLPPLLPALTCTRDLANYNPGGETRSLMQRARRPLIVVDHAKARAAFELGMADRAEKRRSTAKAKKAAMQRARRCTPEVLEAFVSKIEKMQKDNKRGEMLDFDDELRQQENEEEGEKTVSQLENHQRVIGLLDERDLKEMNDIEEKRIYLRAIQENHPVKRANEPEAEKKTETETENFKKSRHLNKSMKMVGNE
jgi:hypothetical protein